MGKERKIVQMIATLAVIVIGVIMLTKHQWGTSPALSGLAFIFAGLALWMNHCPLMKFVFEKKSNTKDGQHTCGSC